MGIMIFNGDLIYHYLNFYNLSLISIFLNWLFVYSLFVVAIWGCWSSLTIYLGLSSILSIIIYSFKSNVLIYNLSTFLFNWFINMMLLFYFIFNDKSGLNLSNYFSIWDISSGFFVLDTEKNLLFDRYFFFLCHVSFNL